jgi:hypothetical protein
VGGKEGKRKPCWVSWEVMTLPKHLGGLGFRHLELFNLCLLARQPWRILTEPNSLSARILQAVYYPNGSILDVELGSHPSQIWRSILGDRDILVQSLIRRIGDGRSTNIWTDNWLPRNFMMKPLVSIMINPPQMVSELIDETMATWKTNLVHACFLPMDAAIILGIPLCTRRQSNFWAWSLDRKGQFSVKSAYRMISSIKSNRENYYERC